MAVGLQPLKAALRLLHSQLSTADIYLNRPRAKVEQDSVFKQALKDLQMANCMSRLSARHAMMAI